VQVARIEVDVVQVVVTIVVEVVVDVDFIKVNVVNENPVEVRNRSLVGASEDTKEAVAKKNTK
jgi:hypothetical protein